MTTLEELGLLKMDFLGLRTLTVMHDAETMVRETIDPAFCHGRGAWTTTRRSLRCSPPATPTGCSSSNRTGMRQVLAEIKPTGIEDMIAVISLYRPGPMDSIPTLHPQPARPPAM